MASEDKKTYEVAPAKDGLVVDLSKPYEGILRFTFVRESGKSSAIIRIVPPNPQTSYSFGSERVSYIRLSRSDLSTMFQKAGDLEYTCAGAIFTDLLDDVRSAKGMVPIKKYKPRA